MTGKEEKLESKRAGTIAEPTGTITGFLCGSREPGSWSVITGRDESRESWIRDGSAGVMAPEGAEAGQDEPAGSGGVGIGGKPAGTKIGQVKRHTAKTYLVVLEYRH